MRSFIGFTASSASASSVCDRVTASLSRNGGGRQERAIARRIRGARFPNQGSLEDFDWSFNAAAIDRIQIEQLATGDWVERFENLVLLIVDEFGLDYVERRLDPQAGHLLFKVIAARNGKSSTAVGTNIEFDAWGEYLGDAPLAMALLDRVVDRAVLLSILGKSYRASRAKRSKAPRPPEPNT